MKALFRFLGSRLSLMPANVRAIFVCHDVSAPGGWSSSGNSTPQPLFERQIGFLAQKFRFVPLGELYNQNTRGRFAALTFDDGFRSVLLRAAPFLREHGIPFAIFANRNALRFDKLDYDAEYDALPPSSGGRIYLSEEELRELAATGVTIGGHGTTHAMLSRLDDQKLNEEIEGNRTYLEALLGKKILHYAFAYGKPRHYDERAILACRRAGHRFLYTAEPAYFFPGSAEPAHPLPRISLHLQDERALQLLLNRLFFQRTQTP